MAVVIAGISELMPVVNSRNIEINGCCAVGILKLMVVVHSRNIEINACCAQQEYEREMETHPS